MERKSLDRYDMADMSDTIACLKRKHLADDMSVCADFEALVMAPSSDTATVKAVWDLFPDATWTRASGHLFEDIVRAERYDLARLFYDHGMFRMAGKDAAESLKHRFMPPQQRRSGFGSRG